MYLAEKASLKGMNSAMAAIIQFETQAVTKLLNNCESWIGVTENHIQRLQDIQNKFLRRVLIGTPKGMMELDGQILMMHLRIMQKKLRLVGKIMAKHDVNPCKRME